MTQFIEDKIAELRAESDVEERVHKLRASIWRQKYELFDGKPPENLVELLEPGIALKLKGFSTTNDSSLGEMWDEGSHVRVAGIVDHRNKLVRIAVGLTPQEHRFTAAHELGHVDLHPEMDGLHRDRVASGPRARKAKHEQEADQFASCFLMPARLTLERYQLCFGLGGFKLDEDSLYGLRIPSFEEAIRRFRSVRDISLAIATATSYMGRSFNSMAAYFKVSPTAMARRLEEVGLVGPSSLLLR